MQFLAHFLTEFMPTNSTSLQTFSYFQDLPQHHGRSPYIDIGSAALSLVYLGQTYGKKDLLHLSLEYYQSLLKAVRIGMAKQPTEDVIIGTAILSMYEVYNPLQTFSWAIHVRAACNLIATRGPETPINLGLLCLVRTLGFYESMGRRKATFSLNPRWSEIVPKNEPFEQLLSIVLSLPRLAELYDEVEQTASAKHLFLSQFRATYSKLRQWYLELLYSQKTCTFKIRAAEPGERFFVADYPELMDTFPEVIIFSRRYICQLLLLCWTGFFVLNYEASKFMRTLKTTIEYTQDSRPSSPAQHECLCLDRESMLTEWSGSLGQGMDTELSKVEECTEVFAERICQAIVYADMYTHASAMKLILICPLWNLQQYFINKKDRQRSLWCQCALQSIPGGIGSVLSKLSVQQYQAISGGAR
ncbi:hypothetical protein N7510_001963 [Penicillium lagena]|uniref:uncharacterized protein n=1 Tax=Penicillium lagena TaxID=94218 RepID=UPI002542505D|nr:uncharacterized protein N7510_001963 [Penicillium lagena]KAJ5625654.1 hypothetical protein N7510_001963 [Penicillium lagena]